MRADATAIALAIGLALGCGFALPALADDAPLRAVEQELKVARGHLQDAPHDYGGHRRAAIDHIEKALEEIRLALRGGETGKTEPKEHHPSADDADGD